MKIYRLLKTKAEYKAALKRMDNIFDATPPSKEFYELELLLLLIKDYEDKHFHIPTPDPIEAIKLKMEECGLKAKDLEPIIGSKGHVSSILSGRRELTLKMAQRLRDFFQLPSDIFIRTSA
jgi:HTH-type transcriptional regulator/antitoxin HigA